MKISGVALGQWNSICKKKEGVRRTRYKIYRAIAMGKVSHVYESGDYIIRYYDINVLVSKTGLILTVWRDNSRELHYIRRKTKENYDETTTYKQNLINAMKKHKSVLKRISANK
jgi:hypothetical protein